MLIVLFRSRLTPEAANGYGAMAEQMSKLARSSPGFIAEKGFVAEDGERLTVLMRLRERAIYRPLQKTVDIARNPPAGEGRDQNKRHAANQTGAQLVEMVEKRHLPAKLFAGFVLFI